MATRKELEQEAKKAGVDNPDQLPTKQEVKAGLDVATGRRQHYFYPQHEVTVIAKDQQEADNLLQEQLTAKEKTNA